MNWKNRLKWIRKRFSWNYKYAIGKWDYMGNEEARYKAIAELIKKSNIDKPRILDLGCGYGALNRYLDKNDYSYCLGIDLSDNAISKAKKMNFPNSEFKVADIHRFTPKEKFDIIIFNEVLYYLDNQMEIVSKFSNYFDKKGCFIFSFYGGRQDLIDEIGKKFTLSQSVIVPKTDNNTSWSVSLYKTDK